MKISLKFSRVPLLYKAMNKRKDLEFDFPGVTLGQLMEDLKKEFGVAVEKTPFNRNHNIDMEIRVVLNDDTYLVPNRMNIPRTGTHYFFWERPGGK